MAMHAVHSGCEMDACSPTLVNIYRSSAIFPQTIYLFRFWSRSVRALSAPRLTLNSLHQFRVSMYPRLDLRLQINFYRLLFMCRDCCRFVSYCSSYLNEILRKAHPSYSRPSTGVYGSWLQQGFSDIPCPQICHRQICHRQPHSAAALTSMAH
jgi:hypothetical protein